MSTFSAAGCLPEPRHLLDVAAERDEPAGAGVGADVANRQGEALGVFSIVGSSESERWVLAMQIGSVPRPAAANSADSRLGGRVQESTSVGAVDPRRDSLDLRRDRVGRSV